MRSVVAAVLVLLAGAAQAQPGLTPSLDPTPTVPASAPSLGSDSPVVRRSPERVPPPAPRPGEVSANTALTISLGGTLASWAVLAAGIGAESSPIALTGALGTLLLPSAGSWYAGEAGGIGLTMRAVGAIGVLYAASNATECDDYEASCNNNSGGAGAVALAGVALYLTGTIVDLAAAPSAARRHNRELRALSVAPTVHPGGGGVMVLGRF